ncbi:MAG: glucosamine-6-phosphate deaminase [Firmicutes bacterium]|nr:glucosamine-6-phosphate deaminase [Bacillota bacterium]
MVRPERSFEKDKLMVEIYRDRPAMGQAAAACAARKMRELLEERESVNVAFAAAPSQNEFLEALINEDGIDWQRVRAFHLDEYLGLPSDAPQRFRVFLDEHIFSQLDFMEVHYLRGDAGSPEREAQRYADLLREYPLDIAFIGIGENGHIAFNDPPVADFADPCLVKIVTLDEKCRRQQVNDGCFPSIDKVPTQALTLTIPAVMSAEFIYCMVPGKTKQEAVKETIEGQMGTHCPATILRTHDAAILYVDQDSANLISRS